MTDKIKVLLDFETADKKVDALEKKVISSDERKTANAMKARYEKAIEKRKELIAARDDAEVEMQNISKEIDKLVSLADVDRTKDAPENVDAIKKLVADIEKLLSSLKKLQDKVKTITSQVEAGEKEINQYTVAASKAKDKFNSSKEAYAKILEQIKPELDALKAERDAKAKLVDAQLLNKYNTLKKNKVSPTAVLKDKRCSGCNMEMPAFTVSAAIKEGYCECENCGRILYVE